MINLGKEFPSPRWESNPRPSRYCLDALTTELWGTHREQGHILGDIGRILGHVEPCCYGRTCVTHKNLGYDLAHHESPIAQLLKLQTDTWKIMGLTFVGGSETSFSKFIGLRVQNTVPLHHFGF